MGLELSTIALAGQLIGGAVQAVGVMGGISSQNAIAQYQAQVARNNQDIAKENARQIEIAGKRRAEEEGWKVRGFLGEQRAAQAASGLDIGSGSAFEVREGARKLGRRSIRNIEDQTRREAYNQRVIAANAGSEAKLLSAQGSESSLLPVMGSLLGTAAGVGKSFLDFKNSGVPMGGLELIF